MLPVTRFLLEEFLEFHRKYLARRWASDDHNLYTEDGDYVALVGAEGKRLATIIIEDA